VVSHVLLDRRHRFDQGFAEYVEVFDPRRPHEVVTTGEVTDAALQLLSGFEKQRDPFFLFVHYFDPHYNYKRHPEVGFAPDSAGRLNGDETIADLYEVMDDMTAAEIALVEAIYDEEIRHTDGGVGRLLQVLRESGRFEDTWIVVLSDHGEEFMEHGNIGHTITLFEELVKVPLVIRPPGHSAGSRSLDAPVSLVSLTPTLLDGLEIDSGLDFQGQSLLPLMAAGGEGEDVIYCETDQLVNKRGAIVGRYKIVRDENTGGLELYDIIADPTEQFDRSELDPELTARFVSILDRRIAWTALGPVDAEPLRLTDEELQQLKSLGYVGN